MADATLTWAPTAIGVPPGLDAAYDEAWFSWLGLLPDKIIPAVPARYSREEQEGRVLYIKGFPNLTTPAEVRAFFSIYGKVDKCITVVDLLSKFSFRWVIMANAQDIRRITWSVQGLIIDGEDGKGNGVTYIMRICSAIGGTRHLLIHPDSTVDRAINGDSGPELPGEKQVDNPPSPNSPELPTFGMETEAEMAPEPPAFTREEAVGTPDIVVTAAAEESVTVTAGEFVTQAETWARIASSANAASGDVELHPENQVTPVARFKSVDTTPSLPSLPDLEIESIIEQMRVVFLLDIPKSLNLQDVSDAVKEGALRNINFGIDADKGTRFAGLIFQYARDAEAFHQALCTERIGSKPGRFKFVVESIRGEAFPMDETIKAMGEPSFATRRLTLVKSKFFFMFGERQLRQLCERLVPRESIQLIWLYNGGNGTIVFGDVNSAISVKYAMDKMSRGLGLPAGQSAATWEGLSITFSKDPCVAPLEFKVGLTRH